MVLDLRLPPRTSADEVTKLVATAWYVFVSCSVAAFSKMMTHDPFNDLPVLVVMQAVRENCDGSYLSLSTECAVTATWQLSRCRCAATLLWTSVNCWLQAVYNGVVAVVARRRVVDEMRVLVVVVAARGRAVADVV